ncbi:MAG: helix-turn-helix domain-containing protein [Phycisphaeraceae bacterium]
MKSKRNQPKPTTDSVALQEFLKSGGVAELLGVSERTVFSLRQEHELPYIPVGNSIRYSREAVIKWANGRQRVNRTEGEGESRGKHHE